MNLKQSEAFSGHLNDVTIVSNLELPDKIALVIKDHLKTMFRDLLLVDEKDI